MNDARCAVTTCQLTDATSTGSSTTTANRYAPHGVAVAMRADRAGCSTKRCVSAASTNDTAITPAPSTTLGVS